MTEDLDSALALALALECERVLGNDVCYRRAIFGGEQLDEIDQVLVQAEIESGLSRPRAFRKTVPSVRITEPFALSRSWQQSVVSSELSARARASRWPMCLESRWGRVAPNISAAGMSHRKTR